MMLDALAEWVRTNRTALGWTQSELSRRLSIDVGSISRWERSVGAPGLKAFRRMCVLFDCSADKALGLPEPFRKRRCATADGAVNP